jgi:hypothetical protein
MAAVVKVRKVTRRRKEICVERKRERGAVSTAQNKAQRPSTTGRFSTSHHKKLAKNLDQRPDVQGFCSDVITDYFYR